jgi:hypothetical protein
MRMEKSYKLKTYRISIFQYIEYYYGYHIRKVEMDRAGMKRREMHEEF